MGPMVHPAFPWQFSRDRSCNVPMPPALCTLQDERTGPEEQVHHFFPPQEWITAWVQLPARGPTGSRAESPPACDELPPCSDTAEISATGAALAGMEIRKKAR